MRTIKQLFGMAIATAVTTLTACKVVDMYNTYAHDGVARANLKKKIKKLNPFKHR